MQDNGDVHRELIIVKAIIDALVRVPVSHVINVSSDAVYGDEPAPLTEHAPAAPESLHGAMHLAREIAFRSEIPTPLAIVRPTLIYGASDPHNGYGPNRFRRQAARAEESCCSAKVRSGAITACGRCRRIDPADCIAALDRNTEHCNRRDLFVSCHSGNGCRGGAQAAYDKGKPAPWTDAT